MNGDQLVLPIVEIKGKLKKFWYIDSKTLQVKRLDEYKGVLEKFDPNCYVAIDKKGKKITVYRTCRLATLACLKLTLSKKKDQWDEMSKTMLYLNNEIGEVLAKIQKLDRIEDE
jgi:hypothetical protein